MSAEADPVPPQPVPDAKFTQDLAAAIAAAWSLIQKSGVVVSDVKAKGYTWQQIAGAAAIAMSLLLSGGGITGLMMHSYRTEPPAQTPIVDVAPLAKAMESMGSNIKKAIDAQTDVLKAPAPAPGPTPIPDPPPVDGLSLTPPEQTVVVGQAAVFRASAKGDVTWWCDSKTATRDFHGPLAVFTPTEGGDFPVAVSTLVDGKAVVRIGMVRCLKAPQPPPVPPIPPPIPVDLFKEALQKAYQQDGKPADKLARLMSFYKLSPTVINDLNNKTAADIFAKEKLAIEAVLQEPEHNKKKYLPSVRAVITAELDKKLPMNKSSLEPLDAATRDYINEQFQAVYTALKGVTP